MLQLRAFNSPDEKGEIRSRLSEAELNKKAQETLGDWLFTEKGFIDALEQRRHYMSIALYSRWQRYNSATEE